MQAKRWSSARVNSTIAICFLILGIFWNDPEKLGLAFVAISILVCLITGRHSGSLKLTLFVLFLAFICDLNIIGAYLAYAKPPTGNATVNSFKMYFFVLALAPMLAFCVLSPILSLIFRKEWKKWLKRFAIVAVSVTCLFASYKIGDSIKMAGLLRVTKELDPLVTAIKTFQIDQGHLPNPIDALVPCPSDESRG